MNEPISDATKHQISIRLVDALDHLGRNEKSLEDILTLIDDIAASYPGGERQQNFYQAVRELAGKVAKVNG